MFALGQFFGPVLKVAEHPTRFDTDEKTRIFARFFHDRQAFNRLLIEFCNTGEPGHQYVIQLQQAQGEVEEIRATMSRGKSDEQLLDCVKQAASRVLEILLSIPVPVDSVIHEAHTPFSTYCFVKDLCSTVRERIVWLDRYFDQTIFHRFFVDTPKDVQVTLVTLPRSAAKSRTDVQRVREFMDVSRLFAEERGPEGYRLIAKDGFHDRWLQCDNKLFTLGGSIKDLAKPFTISTLDASAENLKHFEDVVAEGEELFGPDQPTHP